MRTHGLHVVVFAALVVAFLGCSRQEVQDDDTPGDDDSGSADDDSGSDDDDTCVDNPIQDDQAEIGDIGACVFTEEPAGIIEVNGALMWSGGAADWWYYGYAFFQDGPAPVIHEVVVEDGECRVLRAEYGTCEHGCDEGEICTSDDVCVPYPDRLYGGSLAVSGAGDPVELEWTGNPAFYFEDVGPFDSNDTITATLSGDEVAGFEVQARGVDLIDEELSYCGVELEATKQVVFTWTPGPDPDACVELLINGYSNDHGLPLNDIIECHSPDDGQIVISSEVMGAFPLWHQMDPKHPGKDWPPSELTRYNRATVDVEQGSVDFVVRSTIPFYVNLNE